MTSQAAAHLSPQLQGGHGARRLRRDAGGTSAALCQARTVGMRIVRRFFREVVCFVARRPGCECLFVPCVSPGLAEGHVDTAGRTCLGSSPHPTCLWFLCLIVLGTPHVHEGSLKGPDGPKRGGLNVAVSSWPAWLRWVDDRVFIRELRRSIVTLTCRGTPKLRSTGRPMAPARADCARRS